MTLKARITAIDRFIKGCKEDGIYDDLQAACVMAGWDSLAGALTPLKGAAPTNSGFIAADYDRGGIGITGDGTSYLNSNRASNDDATSDCHASVFVASIKAGAKRMIGAYSGSGTADDFIDTDGNLRCRSVNTSSVVAPNPDSLFGINRTSATSFTVRVAGQNVTGLAATAVSPGSQNWYVFTQNNNGSPFAISNSTLAFYSIGSATDLALIDARVSTLMADLRAIEETGFDRDAIGYLRAVEEADGAYLETSVKIAINNLVSGLKADGLWDAIGSSCLLCGPRTLAGALVPLRGDAPTPYGFVSGDHSRTDGLRDPGGTSYLDSGFNVSAEYLNDVHISAYSTLDPGGAYKSVMGAYESAIPSSVHMSSRTTGILANVNNNLSTSASDTDGIGFIGVSRSNAANANARAGGTTFTEPDASIGVSGLNVFVFARNNSGSASASDMRLAFYSAGTFLDLAKLDSHVSAYVTAIGAAI